MMCTVVQTFMLLNKTDRLVYCIHCHVKNISKQILQALLLLHSDNIV